MKVVVVGGGIIGCAAAYELAKAGSEVTVVERATPGAEASGAAAGMLAPMGESAGTGFRDLAVASWRLYGGVARELRERTGIDVEYVTHGAVYPLFTAEAVREAEARVRQTDRAFGLDVWDEREARSREPGLAPGLRGALFVGAEHWVNNRRLTVAFAQAAVSAGARLLTGSAVSRIVLDGGRARGVILEGETIAADAVLLAAGAWTGGLAESFGTRLPVEPRRGQMVALVHLPPIVTRCIHGYDVYLVPRPSGELLVGATVERVGFQAVVTVEGVRSLLDAAIRLVPGLKTLAVSRMWYGFRPWAPDSLPILGPWPGIEGLWVATAHYRNGILLAPITGRVMKEWMLEGQPSMPLKDFLPDRFLRG